MIKFDLKCSNNHIFEVSFEGKQVISIRNQLGIAEDFIRLEPIAIGGMYPSHMEDRVLLNWPDVPQVLIDTILVVEEYLNTIFAVILRNLFKRGLSLIQYLEDISVCI